MDNNLLSLIVFSFIAFIIVLFKAKRNNVDIIENINDILIYSFSITLGIVLALSLMIYAMFDMIIFDLSETYLHFGIFISGAFLLTKELKSLHDKFKRKELEKSDDFNDA